MEERMLSSEEREEKAKIDATRDEIMSRIIDEILQEEKDAKEKKVQ